MGKIDPKAIAASVQKLYAKDKKVADLICTGDVVKTAYTEKDVIALPEGHPFRALTGLPGLPFNKIVQVAGKPDTGKSTTAGLVMAAAQAQGAQVILWDSEDKFDAHRFQDYFGGDPDGILMARTNEILKGGELIRKYVHACKSADPDCKILIVWDSVGGSQSRTHAERELDDKKHAQPGQDAKENGQVMKTLISLINKYPDSLAVYLANQTYAKMGFMQKGDAASGGTKIEFHSSLIVFLKRLKVVTNVEGGQKIKTGIITQATVTKNHLSHGEKSVYQMNFLVTADSMTKSDFKFKKDDSDDEDDEE